MVRLTIGGLILSPGIDTVTVQLVVCTESAPDFDRPYLGQFSELEGGPSGSPGLLVPNSHLVCSEWG